MRILLANEPRSYREAFADAFCALRPHVEVITVEPEALEEEVLRLRPDVVVCSRITPAIRTATRSWMEVRVEGEALLVRTSETGRFYDLNPGLETLLAFVDRSGGAPKRSAQASQERVRPLTSWRSPSVRRPSSGRRRSLDPPRSRPA